MKFTLQDYDQFETAVEYGLKSLSKAEMTDALERHIAIRGYVAKGVAVIRVGFWENEQWAGDYEDLLLLQAGPADVVKAIRRKIRGRAESP